VEPRKEEEEVAAVISPANGEELTFGFTVEFYQ
jgi:hypothetical protein